MKYSRAELLVLGGLLTILVTGVFLVLPKLSSRINGDDWTASGTVLAYDLTEGSETASLGAEENEDAGEARAPEAESGQIPQEAGPDDLSGGLQEETAAVFFVYITGAVNEPGVVEVEPGTRLFEALEKAGGASDSAALQYINLALRVEDGQMIYIPTVSELKSGKTSQGLPLDRLGQYLPTGCASSIAAGATGGNGTGDKLNVNTAAYQELISVPSIGPTLARRILTYRAENGPFRSLSELLKVNGIGTSTLNELKHYLRVD